MRARSLTVFLALATLAALTACGGREQTARATGEAAKGEIGGYAGDLAAPPAKAFELSPEQLDANVRYGTATDSKEEAPQPSEEEKAAIMESAKAEHEELEAKSKAKSKAAAKAEGDEHAGHDHLAPGEKREKPAIDKSGDEKWAEHDKPVAAWQTKHGVYYTELWPEAAPKTVQAIAKLVREKFYDDIVVHRVEPKFVIQFGDPQTKEVGARGPGVGSGGPGFTLPDEFSTTLKHERGILSMANTGRPNSQGSQMFVVLEPAPFLDGKYTIFGKVLDEGMKQVDKVAVGDIIEYAWMVKDLPADKR